MADYKLSYTGQEIDEKLGTIPNWDQNDPTAIDYIKNRPFYSVTDNVKKIVLQSTPIVNNSVQWNKIPFTKKLVAGETYDITFKLQKTGENTELIATVPVVAKLASELNSLPQGLEDFVILQCRQQSVDFEGASAKVTFIFWNNVDYSDGQAVAAEGISSYSLMCGAGTITAEIDDIEETVYKLNSKYLDTVSEITDKTVENAIPSVKAIREYSKGGSSNWEQHDPDGPGYIENKPFYEKIDVVTHLVTPREVECFSGNDIGRPGYVGAEINLDSRTDKNFANTIVPEHGGDFYLEIDGEQNLISLEPDGNYYYDEQRFYFGNKSIMDPSLPNTGEKFFGQIYIEEDYEYINNIHYDFNTLRFVVIFESSTRQHTIGLRYVDKMILGYLPEGEEFEDDYETDSGDYVYYQEFNPFGMLIDSFEDYYDTVSSMEEYLDLYNKFFKCNFYYGNEIYRNFDWSLYNYVDRYGDSEQMIYFGNINIYHSAGPDTGEPFVVLPEWDGYPTVLSRDNISPMMKLELAELPQISNIKKIEEKFLPDNFIQKGRYEGGEEFAISAGPQSSAAEYSVAIGGMSERGAVAIGNQAYGAENSVIIGSHVGNSSSDLSVTFTRDSYNCIKISLAYLNHTSSYDTLKSLSKWVISFPKSSVNDTDYDERYKYLMTVEEIQEGDNAWTARLWASDIPYDELVGSGECKIIMSNYAGEHSILLNDGFAAGDNFASNANVYGEDNISVGKTNGPYNSYTLPSISGSNNVTLGQSNVTGDNNVLLNSQLCVSGDNNIEINSMAGPVNNSIHLNTGCKITLAEETFGGSGYDHNGPQYPTVSKGYESKLHIGGIYYIEHGSYNVDLNNIPLYDLYQLIGYEPSLKYPEDCFRLFFKSIYYPSAGLYTHNNTYEVYGLVNISQGDNCLVIGEGNYSTTDDQIVVGKYAKLNNNSAIVIGNGENNSNRKNLLEINKRGIATIESLEIRNSNNEASYISQDCMVLRDVDTGWEYAYQMKSGALVTILLPTHIEVTNLPNRLEYEQGDSLDPTGMEITAFYPDGTSQVITDFDILPVNNRNFLYDIGLNKVTIRAKLPLSYFTDVEVNVTEFDLATLIDFDYTINSDGTITLNSWKQTLNGESSTEMIIPNSGLIII